MAGSLEPHETIDRTQEEREENAEYLHSSCEESLYEMREVALQMEELIARSDDILKQQRTRVRAEPVTAGTGSVRHGLIR